MNLSEYIHHTTTENVTQGFSVYNKSDTSVEHFCKKLSGSELVY